MKNETDEPAVLALTCDKNMEPGLHVTLYTALQNYSRKDLPVRIHLLLDGFNSRDHALIRKTLVQTQASYQLFFHSIDLGLARRFPALHGSSMAYARLFLADLLKDEDRFIYLDCDLVIKADLHVLFLQDLSGHPLGVVNDGFIKQALERNFFLSHGFKPESRYFNSGVLLVDAKAWRLRKLTEKCLGVACEYSAELLTQDQTVLNYVMQSDVQPLEPRYNTRCYPLSPKILNGPLQPKIFHFLGSPKPWDFGGSWFHGNYNLFYEPFKETAMSGKFRFRIHSLVRAVRLARSYLTIFYHHLSATLPQNLSKQSLLSRVNFICLLTYQLISLVLRKNR